MVSAALASAGAARGGLAAAGINVARELGGVVAVAGLGALAVTRLSNRLSATLSAAHVPERDQPALLDALLGARTDEVTRLPLNDIGLDRTLKLNDVLSSSATASFIGPTQLILGAAGGVLVALGLLSGWLLRPATVGNPQGLDPVDFGQS